LKTPVVVDSTCLIGLERIGALDLIPSLFDPVYVPPAVAGELGVVLPWFSVVAPSDRALLDALSMLVDAGETEAIARAREVGGKVVLDDRRARSVAEKMGLSILGTIGLLVQAKRAGLVSAIRPLLEHLESLGFHMSEGLKEEALRLVGE
jgi:predicted nucleic acid-binding protein